MKVCYNSGGGGAPEGVAGAVRGVGGVEERRLAVLLLPQLLSLLYLVGGNMTRGYYVFGAGGDGGGN